MLDSLVRVSRRVLRVPKAVASPTGIGPRRGHEARDANVLRPVEGEPYDQQRARTGDGARSVNLRVPWRALATASTHALPRRALAREARARARELLNE